MDSEIFLNKIIKDKKVAIIGPADYINKELDNTHGNYIDNKFDIVIRLNGMIDIIDKDLEKYFYGTKFDVLFSSFWHQSSLWKAIENKDNNVAIPRFLFEESYKKLKENTILYEANNRNLFNTIYRKFNKTIDEKKLYYLNSSQKTYFNAINLLNSIHKITSTPTTGMLSIAIVLSHKPKLLYVSGVTTYLDKKYNAYYDNYLRTVNNNSLTVNEWLETTEEKTNGFKYKGKDLWDGKTYNMDHPSAKDHPFLAEQKIFKYLVTNKIIKVDKYLKKLIKSID